ncbi:MAG: hypothetical protein DCC71_05310 [Proteobacteria bacterium]|nr:MAG: hypothetical protein DCC71_05310 [Pseudomonadota bacterium]
MRAAIAAAGALWLLGTACGEVSSPGLRMLAAAGGACGTVYLAGIEESFALGGDLTVPGASPALTFDAFVPGAFGDQILLTRELTLRLPDEFGFAGFDFAGAGTVAAEWMFDYSDFPDPFNQVFDEADYVIPVRATGADSAYADALANASFDDGQDPTVTHALAGEQRVFSVFLPSGGTNNNGNASDPCSYFPTATRLALPAGLVTLPAQPGSYTVEVLATSVDPDTGDLNDQQGAPPMAYQRSFQVQVPEPDGALAGAASLGALALRARRARAREPR